MAPVQKIVNGVAESYPSLYLHATQSRGIMQALVETLAISGLETEALYAFKTEKGLWEIPPRYSEDLMGECLIPACAPKQAAKAKVACNTYEAIVEEVGISQLVTPEYIRRIVPALDTYVSTATFTTGVSGKVALAYAVIDYTLAYWKHAKFTMYKGSSFYVRVRNTYRFPLIGIQEGCVGAKPVISEAMLHSYLHEGRGWVSFPTLDVLDRAYAWVMRNYDTVLEMDKVLRAITLLKMQNKFKVAYDFEQALIRRQNYQPQDTSMVQLLYTADNLQSVRDVWLGTNDKHASSLDRLQELYDTLVPTYIDHDQYVELFKIVPMQVKRMSYASEKKINEGMEKFITLFLQRLRAVQAGKRVI